jgi:hypothetical protein
MSENPHARARHLVAQARVEGIGDSERDWLAGHLSDCGPCAALASETANAVASLRAIPVELPRNLASRTQLRVRLRAEELRERAPGRKLLWGIAGVSWALGVATAPWVWRGFEWVGQQAGLPKPVWEVGVVLWWAVPALIAAGAVIFEKRGRAQEID